MSGWLSLLRVSSALAPLILLSGPTPNRTAPATTVMVTASNFVFTPTAASAAQGDVVQWNFVGPNPHTATEQTGLQLFNSGISVPGATYPFTFIVAGTYQYHCSIHPTLMMGTVSVPLIVSPTTLPLGASVTVTWASAPIPVGYVVDLEVKQPGGANFRPYLTGTTLRKGTGIPPAAGTYSFRVRLRRTSNGATSMYSPVVTINVT